MSPSRKAPASARTSTGTSSRIIWSGIGPDEVGTRNAERGICLGGRPRGCGCLRSLIPRSAFRVQLFKHQRHPVLIVRAGHFVRGGEDVGVGVGDGDAMAGPAE